MLRRRTGLRHGALPSLLLASIALACAGTSGCGGASGEESESRILVFSAMSLRDVMLEAGTAFEKATGTVVDFNFAGTNVLARQLEAAPAAEVFLSANERWMDRLEEKRIIAPDTRRSILSNTLILVGHKDGPFETLSPAELATAPFRYLAVANPDAVPAGRYARSYLSSLPHAGGTLWDAVKDRCAPTADVRATLLMVESEPEIVGFVYKTDASISDRIRILYEVPREDGPPIRYSVALVAERASVPGAREFLEFLQGAACRALFEEHGFLPL